MMAKGERLSAREQDAKERMDNFDEVSLGYDEKQARAEAERCLQCKKPACVGGCPVGIDIPAFIKLLKEGNPAAAIKKIKEKNSLPAVCGRVCPQENQCEKECILAKKSDPIAIGLLERFAADSERSQDVAAGSKVESKGKKVAVVGSGPASLVSAGDLAKLGYSVTIFEALHKAGGVLVYGIPEFRLPKKIVEAEIDYVKGLGVEIRTNFVIGNTLTVDDLFEQGYEAVFIGTGAGLPHFLGIEGENLNGVYSANEFLTRVNLMKSHLFPEHDTPIKRGHKVVVVGGGNVAMDSARTAKRLGASEVYLVYRRTEEEMPARAEEAHHAKEEGIIFKTLTLPRKLIGESGWLKAIECIETTLGEPDASGRRRPVIKEGSNFTLEADVVIAAVGTGANPLLLKATPKLKLNPKGYIEADEKGTTSMKGVFAGGDIITGSATVILAMGAGKQAAASIDEYLSARA
ncbi:MAG: NADPH-dependent glutamate synthase [Actinomycetota bacterium]|nr:NADPH-dependent glutamate synthase [Actinomycetota bacterium]